MIKTGFSFFFLFVTSVCVAQNQTVSSLELLCFRQNFVNRKNSTSAYLNLGGSLIYSEQLNNVKVSVGLSYAPFGYHNAVTSALPSNIKDISYKSAYINLPLFATFPISNKDLQINFQSGIVLNRLVYYNVKTTLANNKLENYKAQIDRYINFSLLAGIKISKKIHNKVYFNLSTTFDFKPIPWTGTTEYPANDYRSFSDIRMLFVINIGLERILTEK